MEDRITLRPVTEHDSEFLYRLYVLGRQDFEQFALAWPEDQREAFLRQQFHLQQSHYRTHYPDARRDIVVHHDTPIGRCYVHRGEQDLHLLEIALLPDYRNQGIGTALVQAVQAEAQRLGLGSALHVEATNPARSLYERLGYRVVEDRGIHVLMRWTGSPSTDQDAE